MADTPMTYTAKSRAPRSTGPPLFTLILRTLSVILTNLITLNGVARLGWNAVPLILLFVLEGVVVLFTDFIKRFFDLGGKDSKNVFVIECVFVLFYGFFASIVFGPYESLQSAIDDGFHIQRTLISGELLKPLAVLIFMRLIRLGHDLMDSGAFGGRIRRSLQLDGGRFMLLLFFVVMLAPLLTRSGPNPTGGLVALVIIKIFGEIFEVWAVRIPGLKPKSADKRSGKRSS
jgi:hypothetical protein